MAKAISAASGDGTGVSPRDSCERCLGEIRVGDDLFGVPQREGPEQRITGLTVCCLDCAPAVALRSGLVLVRRDPVDGYPLGDWEAEQCRGSLDAR